MFIQTCRYIIFVLIFSTAYLLVFPTYSLSSEKNNIAVVISKKIRPYLNVLDGMVDRVAENSNKIEVFFLSNSDKNNNKKIQNKLLNEQYDLCVAVGPDAAEFVWALNEKSKHSKIYTAVLNPDNIIKNSFKACGISLRIPVKTQVQEIARSFPDIKRIGLMFDADHNEWFYKKASNAAKIYGMEIIPLYIDSKIQIPKKIKNNLEKVDCIWMIPDKTIISEKIIQYIIKQGIYNDKGVIGYNSFFIRSGAFFAFEFDYKELGIQTGKKIELYLKDGTCSAESPLFNKIINYKIVRKIGIRVSD